ncbi:hypothetical protein CBOM_06488 [Ceraceosorus bombacis]|uniref:Uncharacterized protein n=1 Tax=Ceraceosorus bombacis TaxID=401625 RepID=A0A0P1BK51_9BASI|nr:hypothetical protein CBOM_06488 [Ceraceosorus bombacis]
MRGNTHTRSTYRTTSLVAEDDLDRELPCGSTAQLFQTRGVTRCLPACLTV